MKTNNETVNDIIREKRTTAREIRSRTRDQFGRELADMLDKEADRLEAAEKNSTMLCHQVCSCEILANMETENERLRAALKPVLECDCWISETAKSRAIDGAADAIKAVLEAQRIYKGMEK